MESKTQPTCAQDSNQTRPSQSGALKGHIELVPNKSIEHLGRIAKIGLDSWRYEGCSSHGIREPLIFGSYAALCSAIAGTPFWWREELPLCFSTVPHIFAMSSTSRSVRSWIFTQAEFFHESHAAAIKMTSNGVSCSCSGFPQNIDHDRVDCLVKGVLELEVQYLEVMSLTCSKEICDAFRNSTLIAYMVYVEKLWARELVG